MQLGSRQPARGAAAFTRASAPRVTLEGGPRRQRLSVRAMADYRRPSNGGGGASGSGSGGGRAREGPTPEPVPRFEAETTQVVIRCLTARAVQKVLLQLEEVDGFAARWLNQFAAAHPPLEGDNFVQQLMLEPPVALVDPYTGRSHLIYPTQLANGVLTVRDELARHVSKALPPAVAQGTVTVLRRHLEEHTYTSGTHDQSPRPSYRDYRRPRGGSRWQRLAQGS